jgi:hypothetical protein
LASDQFYCDPFEDAEDVAQRARWTEKTKRIAGPFVPAGRGLGMGQRPTPQPQLTQILSELRRVLEADWRHCEVEVYADDDGHVIAAFGLSTVASVQGLLAYMNMALNANDRFTQYALCKVPELWNTCVDNKLFFAMRPPWVRVRVRPEGPRRPQYGQKEGSTLERGGSVIIGGR